MDCRDQRESLRSPPCPWGKGSESRCGQARGHQQLPGNTSFRQDWPIRLCDETDCETVATDEDETALSTDWEDPCDENAMDKKEVEVPGPLEQFDERVKRLLEGDIWTNAAQPPKHRSTLPNLLKKVAAGVKRESDTFVANESELRTFAKRLMTIEKNFQFELALKKAEEASATAPEEKIEEIALASARGFTMSMDSERETTITADGSTVVEVISYCGITKPLPEDDEKF